MGTGLTVAAIQMDCVLQHVAENLSVAHGLLDDAADRGAQVAVLPELFSTGYALYKDALLHADRIDGHLAKWLAAQARTLKLHIVGSMVERGEMALYLTTMLVGPQGLCITHRRRRLSPTEDLYYTPGEVTKAATIDRLTVGVLGGEDLLAPRQVSTLRDQGAQLLCSGAALTDATRYGEAVVRAAREGGFYHVAANRIGREADFGFCGGSRIVAPDGTELGSVADDVQGVALATVPLPALRG